MPTIQTVSDQYEYTVPAHQVYKSDTLRGPWELVSYLFVDRLRTVCGPDIDTATLRFDYGFMLPLDSALDQPIKVEPFDLNGKFIKIVIPQPAPADPFTWYGIVELDERARALGVDDTVAEVDIVAGRGELDGDDGDRRLFGRPRAPRAGRAAGDEDAECDQRRDPSGAAGPPAQRRHGRHSFRVR